MGRLKRGLLPSAVTLVLTIAACGPTAQVITTPTPAGGGPYVTAAPSKGEQSSTPPPPGGTLWQPLSDFPSGSALEVMAATATADGFVAVGYEAMPGESSFGRRQGIVWRSADGTSWQQTIEPTFQLVTPEDITTFGDSLYVLGRISACPDITNESCAEVPESGYAVWRSTSGGPWERLAQQPSMQAGFVDDLLAGHDHLAAFGSAGPNDETTTAWFSTDGVSWTETTDIPEMAPISALAEGPAGFVAFGTQLVPALEDVQLRVAVSADYGHFAPAPAPTLQGMTITDVSAGDAGMAAVGYSDVGETGQGSVALWSEDGVSWTLAEDTDGSLASGAMERVHALSGGRFVAVGFTPETGDLGRLTGQSWVSSDGQSWRSLEPLGGSFDLIETSVLGALGLVVFAVAQDSGDDDNITSTISVWFAPAGRLAVL